MLPGGRIMSADICCPVCGEPWEVDSLHDVAESLGTTFGAVRADFRRRGCVAMSCDYFGVVEVCRPVPGDMFAGLARAAFDLLGDDVDGVASFLDDARGW